MRQVTLFLILAIVIASGCSKNNNTYSTTDHTAGMTTVHAWSGNTGGFLKGDTVISGRDTLWALFFAHAVTDSSFAVVKINGFQASIAGTFLNYLATDSVTNKTVTFDTTLSGSAMSVLTYYYLRDSMTFEFHQITGFNSSAGQYYQTNAFLHTIN